MSNQDAGTGASNHKAAQRALIHICFVILCTFLMLFLPNEARADITVDAAVCLNSAKGSLALSSTAYTLGSPPSTITWSTSMPTACSTAGGGLQLLRNGIGVVDSTSPSGYRQGYGSMPALQPNGTSTWTLRITTGQGYKDLAATTLTVSLPGPLTDGSTQVTITGDGQDQKTLFMQAVQTPNTTVNIKGDVELDLSWIESLPVAAGVSILGDRSIQRNGPHLFTTTFPRYLLKVGANGPSDGVHISGIRLDGGESDDPFSAVGKPDADGIAVFASVDIEIDHNEIQRFRGSGVSVRDGNDANSSTYVGRINESNATAVRVHDNYIHHNQHPSTDFCGLSFADGGGHSAGYGVEAAEGAYVDIERNVFDWNRHSIAGDGKAGTGYLAYDNLILTNGGVHFRCPSPGDGVALLLNPFVGAAKILADMLDGDSIYHTHTIDMHGVNPCFPGDHNCGPAGEYMDIEYNTILYTAGNGIHLRGTPAQGMYVINNVFAHKVHDGSFITPGAMLQNETGLHDSNNTLGMNTFSNQRFCDFDGDGTADAFIATGVTWWYQSSAQSGRWVFLHRSPKLVDDVSLGDFDGDGRCDVMADGQVYPNPDPLVFVHSPGNLSGSFYSPVSVQLRAAGGALPWTWTVTGLPPGLSASPSGLISGSITPSGQSSYIVTATVTDNKQVSNSVTFTWTVATVVPNVLSMTQSMAESRINGARLTVGRVSTLNNCVDTGSVMTQNPIGGYVTEIDTAVNITVSTCTSSGGSGGGGTGGGGKGGRNPILPK